MSACWCRSRCGARVAYPIETAPRFKSATSGSGDNAAVLGAPSESNRPSSTAGLRMPKRTGGAFQLLADKRGLTQRGGGGHSPNGLFPAFARSSCNIFGKRLFDPALEGLSPINSSLPKPNGRLRSIQSTLRLIAYPRPINRTPSPDARQDTIHHVTHAARPRQRKPSSRLFRGTLPL